MKPKKKIISKWTKGHLPVPVVLNGVSNLYVYYKGGRIWIEYNKKSNEARST